VVPRPLGSSARWTPRRAARAGAFALLVLLLLVELAGPASAHASLLSSDPLDGAVLGSTPHLIRLSFSEPVELELSRFELQRPDSTHLQLGTPRAVPGKNSQVDVLVPNIARGSYVITWHAATRDTHIASGQILFGLGAAAPKGVKSLGGSSDVLAWTAGAARFAWYLTAPDSSTCINRG
jgi:copper transport protein